MADIQHIESPECERLHAVHEESQKIGEFIEWLGENSYVLANWIKRNPRWDEELAPANISTNALLAQYYDIDLDKVEDERRAILEALQKGGK
jgi:hypothetical protein